MNYKKIYDNLILRAKDRNLEAYVESHHIIPKCLGGTNDPANLVNLTPEEHYVAHQLLVKIYPTEPKIALAARYMCYDSNGKRVNNKMFGWLRKYHSVAMSKINKGRIVSPELARSRGEAQKGRISPMKGKHHSEESRKKTSQSLIGIKRPPRSKEHRENHANSIKGIPRSEETRQKIKESTKGKSFEERYGSAEAAARKEKLRKSWELRKINKISQEFPQP